MKKLGFNGITSGGSGLSSVLPFIVNKYGTKIGLSEEFVKGHFKYRFKEDPGALGIWISYKEALRIAKEFVIKEKERIIGPERKFLQTAVYNLEDQLSLQSSML